MELLPPGISFEFPRMLEVLGACLVSLAPSVSLVLLDTCPAFIPGSSNTFMHVDCVALLKVDEAQCGGPCV